MTKGGLIPTNATNYSNCQKFLPLSISLKSPLPPFKKGGGTTRNCFESPPLKKGDLGGFESLQGERIYGKRYIFITCHNIYIFLPKTENRKPKTVLPPSPLASRGRRGMTEEGPLVQQGGAFFRGEEANLPISAVVAPIDMHLSPAHPVYPVGQEDAAFPGRPR